MPQVVIENPVINSPFAEPQRHFRFSDEGITNEIVNTRCFAQLEVRQIGEKLTYIFGSLFNTLACMHTPILRARGGGTL